MNKPETDPEALSKVRTAVREMLHACQTIRPLLAFDNKEDALRFMKAYRDLESTCR